MGRLAKFAKTVMHVGLQAEGYRSRYAHTSQGRLHYYTAKGTGQLPPMVFLHGLSAHAPDLAPLYRLLRRRTRQIIGVDLPVHGHSDVPHGGIHPEPLNQLFFEGMSQIIRAEDPVILFGNSLGGMGALRFAIRYPERVKALILSSPGGAGMPPEQLKELYSLFQHETQHDPQKFIERLYQKPPVYRAVVEQLVQQRFAHPNLRAFISQMDPENLIKPEEVQQLNVPTLLIWGQQDSLLENQLPFFKEHMPTHVRIEEPKHFTHVPYLESPLELSNKILHFAWLHCLKPKGAPA